MSLMNTDHDMKKFLLSFVFTLGVISGAYAQTVPAQMGITPLSVPEVVQVLDNTNAWVSFGTINASSHTFTATAPVNTTTGTFSGAVIGASGTFSGAISGSSGTIAGAPIMTYVNTNAALEAVSTVNTSVVTRNGILAAGDAPPLVFIASNGVCPQHSGAGDIGSCNPSADGKSWLANPPSSGESAREWGAYGNGIHDDSINLADACTAAGISHVPLLFDALFYIPLGIICPNTVKIIGGLAPGWQGGGGGSFVPCTTGLTMGTVIGVTALTLEGSNNDVEGLCIQMAAAWNSNTSGMGIYLGSGSAAGSGSVIRNNVVNYPFIGIGVTGASTQSAQIDLDHNVVWEPSNGGAAIQLGANGATNDIHVTKNKLICHDGAPSLGNSTAVGLQVLDSGAFYESQNDIFICKYGTEIYPGLFGTSNQSVIGFMSDVLGDTSTTDDLYVNTGNASAIIYALSVTSGWASNATGLSGSSPAQAGPDVLIKNDGAGEVGTLKFTGGIYHASGSAPQAIVFDLEAGSDVQLNGLSICSPVNASATTTGLKISSSVKHLVMTGSHIGGGATTFLCAGALQYGAELDGNGGSTIWDITGNDLAGSASPLNYTPTNDSILLSNNMGLSNTCPTVANAASITIAAGVPCAHISGTGTITDITNSLYANRSFVLIADAGLTFSTGGSAGTKFCTGSSITATSSTQINYNAVSGCWVHIP